MEEDEDKDNDEDQDKDKKVSACHDSYKSRKVKLPRKNRHFSRNPNRAVSRP
jgi:hypothetical protein